MTSGTAYRVVHLDAKGRVVLPADWRQELGIGSDMIAKKEKKSLVLTSIPTQSDPLEFLASIGVKTKKAPIEMKQEAQKVFDS